MSKPSWQERARLAQARRDTSIAGIQPPIPAIPKDLPISVIHLPAALLSAREVEITESKTESLLAALASGSITAREVTGAFLRRAGLAQGLANCISELLPQQALARADELDAHMARFKKATGPLHGLPISVKECIGMKGLIYHGGFVAWAEKEAPDDALLLKIVLKAGCVLYARTNEPQTMMHLETSNNFYGTTVNPFNRSLTAGGSSGGEGALLGLRGSCLGIGSDIGGSIRSPAANQGLYGLKPTALRLPKGGCANPHLGSGNVIGVVGPLSTSLEGVKIFMKTVVDSKPWIEDPSLVPLPWRTGCFNQRATESKRLKIGVMGSDGIVTPHPPVTRAMQVMVNQLKKIEDVQIVEWKPYKHDLASELVSSLYYPDAVKETAEIIDSSGEPWRPLSKRFLPAENPFISYRSPGEMYELRDRMEKYKLEYSQKWNSTASHRASDGSLEGAVDAILCPVGPGVAPPLDCSRYWSYTSQWNLLDYPALVFPVSEVDPDVDVRDKGYTPTNEHDQYNYNLYGDPELFRGAPVSLQLVGRRYEDEKVIEILEYLLDRFELPFASST